jgi:hypothetical protein
MAVLFSLLGTRNVGADELAVDPSIETRAAVNDNYLFTASQTPTVLVLALTPRLSMSDNTENSKLRLDLSATKYNVEGEHTEDHTDLNLSLSYEFTAEREKLKFATGFVRDETYEGELVTTGVLLAPLRRNDFTTTAGWTHAFTERLSGSLQLATEIARYSGPIQGAAAENYHYYAIPVSASYDVTEQDALTLAVTDSLYHADEIHNRSNSDEIQLALEHHFDERGVLSVGVGEFQSTTHLQQNLVVCPIDPEFCAIGLVPFVEIKSRSNTTAAGFVVNGSLQYQLTEKDSVTAHASRDLSPSGVGSLVLVESVDAGVKHDFKENVSGSVVYSRARSQILGASGAFANGFESLVATYSWRPTVESTVEFGARRLQTTRDQPGPSIKSDEVYVNFRYSWPQSAAAQAQ